MNPVDHLAGLRDIIGRGKSFRGRGSWANGPQNMGMNMQNNQHFGMNMQNYAPKYGKGSNFGKIHQRILVPARAIGCIIGKAGSRLNELKERTDAQIIIKGNVEPERLVTVIGDADTVARAIEVIAEFMITDFGSASENYKNGQKLPKILGNGQKPSKDIKNDAQICLLYSATDCGAIIGKGGCKIKTYTQQTGCQVYVHNEYLTGEQFLPGSNEKVVTVTGKSENCAKAMHNLLMTLMEEGSGGKGTRCWDIDQHGPVGFFGEEATWQGSGLPEGFGETPNPVMFESAWGAPIPDTINPMIQWLGVEQVTDKKGGTVICRANEEQLECIKGPVLPFRGRNARIDEIKALAGVLIDVKELGEDDFVTKIKVRQAEHGNDMSVENAVWLMNICINAYCDTSISLLPADDSVCLQDIVESRLYGFPPGLRYDLSCDYFYPSATEKAYQLTIDLINENDLEPTRSLYNPTGKPVFVQKPASPSLNYGNGMNSNTPPNFNSQPQYAASNFNQLSFDQIAKMKSQQNNSNNPSSQNTSSHNSSQVAAPVSYPSSFAGPPMPVGKVKPKLTAGYGGLNVKGAVKAPVSGGPMRNKPIGGFQPRLGKVEKDVGW